MNSNRFHRQILTALLPVLCIVGVTTGGCAVNPATGRSQLMLISEAQEAALGREADPQIVAQYGLYDDPLIQDYVQALGEDLAAKSERPDLPWSFKVLDDPLVNAFALPGGYIYVTRGILAHFDSEAELAAVLGHEIGHVTARHSANQMSKQTLATGLLIAGTIALDRDDQYLGALAGVAAQLMFLKFSRDDERQADSLGLRYIDRQGYDPRPMTNVFQTLGRVSDAAGGPRGPGWTTTHPAPENRVELLSAAMVRMNTDFTGRPIRRQEFQAKIDGIVFGEDPREGYFVGHTFYHPGLALQLEFPEGWKFQNQRAAVVAVSPQQDAMMQMSLAQAESVAEAEQKFYEQSGVNRSGNWKPLAPPTAVGGDFEVVDPANNQSQEVRGRVAFAQLGDNIYQLLSYSKSGSWRGYERRLGEAMGSLKPLKDRRYLDVKPKRVTLVTLDRRMTLEEFYRRYPSTVDLNYLGILNQAQPETVFEKGAVIKRVVGGELPGS